ncbi:hypothetical protein PR048_033476 [Dryococelus australis]|uniref:Tc1-like transposase DDE domain-containing protein n=1 Tax=Dryococelus australis TaxID=614101 RepID=A0ABQ9G1M3_9NEOP|nr:hypothetical protein PR048_033476 [Dryococelus australis]
MNYSLKCSERNREGLCKVVSDMNQSQHPVWYGPVQGCKCVLGGGGGVAERCGIVRHDSHLRRIREWPGRGSKPVRLGGRRVGYPLSYHGPRSRSSHKVRSPPRVSHRALSTETAGKGSRNLTALNRGSLNSESDEEQMLPVQKIRTQELASVSILKSSVLNHFCATKTWYAEKKLHRLDWPAQSPDLNPIEHIWDEVDGRVRARQALPKSIAPLMEWLQEEWRRIPVDVLQTLVESMPDRAAAVIAAKGGPTRF